MKKSNLLLALIALVSFAFSTPNKGLEYKIDTQKSKIVWEGKKVTGGHTGTVDIKEGGFTFEGDQLTGGKFVVDMTTLGSTDLSGEMKNKLDGHLKSDDFFGVATYPTATLVITKVTPQGNGKFNVTGDITIKKTTQTIEFPATLAVKGDVVEASANVTINRAKFDVRYGSGSFFDNLGDKAIYDDFTLAITAVAKK